MKIAVVTPLYPRDSDDSPMDNTRAIHDFVRRWVEKGHEVAVFRPVPWYWLFRKVRRLRYSSVIDGIQVRSYGLLKIPRTKVMLFGAIKRAVARYFPEPDAIVAHYYTGMQAAVKAYDGSDIPIICGIHQTDVWVYGYKGKYLDHAQTLVFRSPSIRRQFIERNGHPTLPSYTIPSGVSASIVRERPSENIEGLLRFVSVAKLVQGKNLDSVIKALALLPDPLKWHYTIVGDGTERKTLEELVLSEGLQDKIDFMGFQESDAVIRILDASDVFVLPSAPETLGMAYLEALARGLVVVGSKGWGIDGIVTDGKDGFLVEPGSVTSLAPVLESFFKRSLSGIRDAALILAAACSMEELSDRYLRVISATVSGNGVIK